MTKGKLQLLLAAVAIVCVTIIEIVALSNGIDGVLLTISVGIIASIATGGAIKLKDVLNPAKIPAPTVSGVKDDA